MTFIGERALIAALTSARPTGGFIAFSASGDSAATACMQLRQDVLDPLGHQIVDRKPGRMNCELLHVVEQRAQRVPEAS